MMSGSFYAQAGHTVINGVYTPCTCGYPGCILEPGECGDGQRMIPTKPKGETKPGSADFTSSIMLILFALFVASRIRG
jgi:hypothetical protein